ncbi:MAG: PhzF family phenazine biosynthesis protein [Pseudomonadota bacterium]
MTVPHPVPYSLVDVFTRTRFAGNPLAVIRDGRGLSDRQMHAIAREFGFSETTFILPPEGEAATARLRIFTPLEEIPFAGYPNIGSVFVMATEATAAGPLGDTVRLEELGGEVRATPIREGGTVVGAEVAAPQRLRRIGAVEPALAARCLGLPLATIRSDRVPPCVASVGLPFAFVELRSLADLAGIVTDIAAFREAALRGPATVDGFAICAFVPDGIAVRSRVLSPLGHPPEDPATGSASAALACLLAGEGDGTYRIRQGVEMGRPSDIDVRVAGGQAVIRGDCVRVGHGTLLV